MPAHGYPFLSHDEHALPIITFLRTLGDTFWAADVDPNDLGFTLIVFDRWNRALLTDARGQLTELPESNPVHLPAPSGPATSRDTILALYCHTHDDGSGDHYDWIALPSTRTH